MAAILAVAAMPASAAAAAPSAPPAVIAPFIVTRCAVMSALMLIGLSVFALIEGLLGRRVAAVLVLLFGIDASGFVHRL